MTSGGRPESYAFGSFRLDPTERLLSRGGRPIALTPKAFDLLVCLVEHHGRLVEKSTLMTVLWPDAIVEEANLAFQISTLRRALDDGGSGEALIQTVPTKGYRFLGLVTNITSAPVAPAAVDEGRQLVKPRRKMRRTIAAVAALAVLLVAIIAAVVWWRRAAAPPRSVSRDREPVLTRLTANPVELSVSSVRISPDGKYVAYSDPTGIQIRIIDTGDIQRLPDTRGMTVYAWTADSTRVRAAQCDQQTCAGWDVSILGGSRQPSGATWLAIERLRATPDGSRLLTISESGDVKVNLLDGSAPKTLVHKADFWRGAAWSFDKTRVYFVRSPGVIEAVSVSGGAPNRVFSADKGTEVLDVGPALSDGRVLAVLVKTAPAGQRSPAAALVEIEREGPDALRTRPLTEWAWSDEIEQVSASTDASRVAFLRTALQDDVYVADFDAHRVVLTTPKRLTLDDRSDFMWAWTPDSTRVIFSSDRNGSLDLFRQRTDSDVAEPFVVGAGTQQDARVTSDGKWVLYRDEQPEKATRIMRVPLTGGQLQELLTFPPGVDGFCHCSFYGRCVVLEIGATSYRVFALDPTRGKQKELAQFPSSSPGATLTPDGEHLAYIVPEESGVNKRIRIVSFGSEASQDIAVENAIRLSNLDAVPTGGFLSQEAAGLHRTLLFVAPSGRSKVLWAPDRMDVFPAFASPDVRHLAIGASTRQSNVWLADRH
jgi:DNA-binding winged helix-turn-helix (wHTH) protein